MLQVRELTLRYTMDRRTVTAVYRVSFVVGQGDRFVILGASGCGKSTLLKALGGYLKPDEGEILLEGHRVVGPGPDRIMMFQEFDQLLPWKTVRENIVFPLKLSPTWRQCSAEDLNQKANSALERVKLIDFADRYPHTLSGGMKQRVALARALALEPRVLLMDEPFAALDELTRQEMQRELLNLWSETKTTLVFVTHSISEAVLIGTRILLLSPHPGQVRAELAGQTQHPGQEAKIHQILFGAVNEAVVNE